MIKTIREFEEIFASPSAAWRGKPFWSWNGELKKEELERQVDVLKEMGFGGHFMHSRAGLITEYLGDEWFSLINAVADKSEKVGMEAWAYDEDRWPSGSAGGKVTKDPRYRMRSLRLTETPLERFTYEKGAFPVFAAYVLEDNIHISYYKEIASENDLASITAENRLEGGRWCALSFDVVIEPDNSNYNGSAYLNTLDKAATERFIEMTHEEYKKRCGDRVGTSIKGIFTDEPHRGHGFDDLREENGVRTCSCAYTDDFFAEFEKRYGYDAVPRLPELFYKYGHERISKIKIDWFDAANDLFLERFAMPIEKWCWENNMLFTGHVLHEDSLCNQAVSHGSLMRFYEHMDVPGMDALGAENYGYRIAKQLQSSARQTGKEHLLSELYGCSGWDFDFSGHKYVGDWQALFGVNLRCPHLSWYTMEGESKRDYPASILHQSPWYKDYNAIETYFARFAAAGAGKPLCDTLVLNPIESTWGGAYLGWAKWLFSADKETDELDRQYEALLQMLLSAHVDFDYGEESMMTRLASVDGNVLKVGKMDYHTVIVGGMLTIRESTLKLLKAFRKNGGKVIFVGDAPRYVGGLSSEEAVRFASECENIPYDLSSLSAAVRPSFDVKLEGDGAEKVFSRAVRFEDGTYALTLLSVEREKPLAGIKVTLPAAGLAVTDYDMLTGEKFAVEYAEKEGNTTFEAAFEPGGSRLYILSLDEKAAFPRPKSASPKEIIDLSSTRSKITLGEKNVCVLERVNWEVEDEKGNDEVLMADRHIRDHFGLEHRGGEMLQPWFSKLYKTEVYGKVTLHYLFRVEALPEGDLLLAGERPEKMAYSLNGTPLIPDGGFWVDSAFKTMKVPASLLRLGENEVTVETDYTLNTNLEACYLVGDFGVGADGPLPVITGLPETLAFGDASKEGLLFYGGNLTYTLPASALTSLRERIEKTGERVFLAPKEVRGSLVKMSSGNTAETCYFKPYRFDATEAILAGEDISLTLVGSRRNTFGPLHTLPADLKGSSPAYFIMEGAHTEDFALPETGILALSAEIV